MESLFGRQLARLRAWAEPFERFVRDYTRGLQARDVERLFRQESLTAYEVLTRDQPEEPVEARQLRLTLHRVKMVFLGLSYKLTPARRLLFAASILCAVLGLLRFNLVSPSGEVRLDDALMWFLLAVGGLLFLLGLELVDRIRFRDEVEVARQLQRDLLPAAAPAVPGYRFAFSYRTANDIGGDYYDFLSVADGRLAVVAGDASGHGIGAGLLMATAKAALQLALEVEDEPRRIAQLVNRVLYKTGGSRAFMTLFVAVLDPPSGRLVHSSAGHPFPLLRQNDGQVTELGQGALPLGVRPQVELTQESISLAPGELLVLYSDGLPEALHGDSGTAYGYERVRANVELGGSAQEVHDRIIASLATFLGDRPPLDDISLVVIAREA